MADALLTVENLTKSYGDKLLFDNISFGINAGQKTALIARNGYGKSTLLNILTGKALQDEGKVTFSGEVKMAYLPQQPEVTPHQTLRSFVYSVERPEHEDEWTFEQRIEEILSRLRLNGKLDQPMDTLSGGEQKKAALSRILIDHTNLLLLDEPTNHLDIEMIEWLEDFLSRQRLAILMVTHDRYFLDHVCQDILEIDNSRLYHYRGTYDYYLQKKAERQHNERVEVEKAKSLYRTELDWMRRMPCARGGKARYRKESFHQLEERLQHRRDEQSVALDVKASYIGKKIFDIEHLSKAFDDKIILKDFSYIFTRYEKLGIIGENGVGKSTFLKLLLGIEQPDSGVIERGTTLKIGYYSQEGLKFPEDAKVIDVVTAIADHIVLDDGRRMSAGQFLQKFLFTPKTQYSYVSKLSGGERRRLYLCTILMQSPNFLILDEPTNDLDIMTLQVLEEYIAQFKGCVIVVSHDRYFMDKIAEHLLVFEGDGKVTNFPSSYSDYMEYKVLKEDEEKAAAAQSRTRQQSQQPARPEGTLSPSEATERNDPFASLCIIFHIFAV